MRGEAQRVPLDREVIVTWISREILPHEAGVRAWLRRAWPHRQDHQDIIQEAYCRLAGAALEQVHNPRAFFFQIIRNLLLEEMRRARVVRFRALSDLDSLGLADDLPSCERVVLARDELQQIHALLAAMPARRRRIFEMRKIEDLSQKDIAARLGVSENVVENETAKALKTILKAFSEASPAQDGAKIEYEHDAGRPVRLG